MVTKWMDVSGVLGFVPSLKYLWSQILRRLYKSPSEQTIDQGPLCNIHIITCPSEQDDNFGC